MILNEVNFFSEVLGVRNTMVVLLPQRSLAETKSKNAFRQPEFLYGYGTWREILDIHQR